MRLLVGLSLFLLSVVLCEDESSEWKDPTVFITILVRNKAHVLPYFLSLLYNLNYPKDRIILYFKSHDNSDNSLEILEEWVEKVNREHKYHSIIKELETCSGGCLLAGETSPVGWNDAKFQHIMTVRQNALDLARFYWSDYMWNLDSDVLLLNPDVLQDLVNANLPVVAPLLTSLGQYSNFWGEMNDDFYYKRSADYGAIRERKKLGCHNVAMVHSSQLIDLRTRESDHVAFHHRKIPDYPGPEDDIIVFALSCSLNDIPMYVCNQKDYGMIMLPLEDHQKLEDDLEILRYVLLESTSRHPPIKIDPIFHKYLPQLPQKSKFGLDEIYMINLERREDRKERMDYNFDLLGINAKHVPAVDGRVLTAEYLDQKKIRMMPGFSEPYHDRPLKLGEIGCFMSHYNIWEEMINLDYEMILVLEDDIRFEPFFIQKFHSFLEELRDRREDWDLAFVGRKILHNAEEWYLDGTNSLVYVDYTHWTLGYVLTQTGARKLIQPEPLSKMIPVDEYIPIMYDRHPNITWMNNFPVRNLKAVSASPRLIFPTHYTGEDGYISDTEDTSLIEADKGEDTVPTSREETKEDTDGEKGAKEKEGGEGHCVLAKDKSKLSTSNDIQCNGDN
eukprot:TRINITY_DN26283_c0_g1_i2.p1 TRINITY_DN26283_c0_g1~~TRINITY_DN26283_c0_g1_i2.p1  ORF type:complete len:617 (-),score=139.72 TRINITY_DN26283_c0_g1_i2:196-2046(-)